MGTVTNYKRIDFTRMPAIERADRGLNGLYNEWSCTEFDEGCGYLCYENIDDKNDHDLSKYAVYQQKDGTLICLASDAGRALDLCYDDNEFRDKRQELYRQIALAAGWPEVIKHYWTWRELRDKLNELDDERLDMTAWVWVHGDSLDGEIGITNLTTYYEDGNLNNADENNHISISIDD